MDRNEKLRQLCGVIDQMCDRIRHRSGKPAAEAGDEKLNTAMMTALVAAGSRMRAYRNFFAAHADTAGRIGTGDRDGYFDHFVALSDATMDLHRLAYVQIDGAVEEQDKRGKLSPMFQRIVTHEKQAIIGLTESLRGLWQEDIAALGQLKAEQQQAKIKEKRILKLVPSVLGPVSD